MSVAPLRVDIGGNSYLLQPSDRAVIGRDPSCRLHLPHPLVSARHLQLHHDGSGWLATDLGSTNGTWIDGRRVAELPVGQQTRIRLAMEGPEVVLQPDVPAPTVSAAAASAPVHPAMAPPPRSGAQPMPPLVVPGPPTTPEPAGSLGAPDGGPVLTGIHSLAGSGPRRDVLAIGRDAGNALVLPDLLVSRRHAELRRTAGAVEIVDLNSANGTYVNGHRVTTARLAEGDLVGIGRHQLRLQGEQLLEYTDTGDFTLVANDLTVQVGSGPATKTLLHHVGFTLPPRSLLAVVGPSGAGKSTMLNALTGTRPATGGTVTYAGRDLYAEFEDIRQRIGLVPQEDIWHTALTVRQALRYGAELRFPADVSTAERESRIDEVLRELGLVAQQHNSGAQLSGGQKKRTSTALELLTKPSLLFLDEPTSGLDPDLDHEVMQLLRGLADDGRTVVVVTHSTLNLHVCDLVLVLAEGGHLAYLGKPTGALDYFRAQSYSEMFARLKSRPGPEWGQRFRGSPEYARHVMGGAATPTPRRRTVLPALRQQSRFSQFSTLCRRYLSVIAADRAYLGILLLLPILLAIISRVVPAEYGLGSGPVGHPNLKAGQLLLVLVLGATLMGSASAVREIVKERAVYLRERSIGLSSGAYLWSKLVVLGVISALQAVLLAVLALVGRPGISEPLLFGATIPELAVAVVVLTVSCAVFGLLISAWVSNADKAMPLLVLMTMVQLVLCGGLVPLSGRPGLEQISWVVPARWGFAMVAASTDLGRIETPTLPPVCQQVDGLPPGSTIGPDGGLPSEDPLADGSTLPPGSLPPGASSDQLNVLCHPDLPPRDPLYSHRTSVWVGSLGMLLALSAAGVGGVSVLLRRLEPKRRAVAPMGGGPPVRVG